MLPERISLKSRTGRAGALFGLLLFTLALAACTDSTGQEGKEWINDPGYEWLQNKQATDIPPADIYEVTASKAAFALMELEETSLVELPPQRAAWFTGDYYARPPDKQAYLVRAVYGHAGTGRFQLERIGDDLLIHHQSLGHSTIYQKTALVVNLDFEPEQIFIRVSIAE